MNDIETDQPDGLDPPQFAWDIFDRHELWDRGFDYTPLAIVLLSDALVLFKKTYRSANADGVFAAETMAGLDEIMLKLRDAKRLAVFGARVSTMADNAEELHRAPA